MLHCERRGSCTPQPWLGSKGGASAPHGPWGQRQPPSCANVPRVRCASAASRCRKTKRAREPRANRCRQADRAQAVLRRTGRHRRRGRKRAGFPPPVVKPGAEGRRNPRCSHGPLSLLRRGVSSGAGTRRGALAARGETAASPSEPGQALTLAPIWLPHWPACRCTISLMVVVVAAAAAAAARQLHVASLLRLSSSSPPPFPPPPPRLPSMVPGREGRSRRQPLRMGLAFSHPPCFAARCACLAPGTWGKPRACVPGGEERELCTCSEELSPPSQRCSREKQPDDRPPRNGFCLLLARGVPNESGVGGPIYRMI